MTKSKMLQIVRRFSTKLTYKNQKPELFNESAKMSAWQIHSYGDLSELSKTNNAKIPHINGPDEVLVKISAASVNPLDVAMIKGYGSTVFNFMRSPLSTVEFPITLGRDFSGYVECSGINVDDLKRGTRIWGVLPPHWQGTHAEYAVVKRSWLSPHPKGVPAIAASGVLYAGLTAWSAINIFGGMIWRGARGKKVLVLGPAGGVGTIAVQLLKADGAHIVCSCSSDAIPLVQSLGVDVALDRNDPELDENIKRAGPYELILDCAGLGGLPAQEKAWDYTTYVTCTSPLLRNTDESGLLGGFIKSAAEAVCPNIPALTKGRTIRWAYFIPHPEGITRLKYLLETGKLKPLVDKVYPFEEADQAYTRVSEGHLRGKVIIDVMGEND